MQWSIYADLERHLTEDEHGVLADAMDSEVTDGGCAGPNRGGIFEVYFTVEAISRSEAEAVGRRVMDALLEAAKIAVGFRVEAQRYSFADS